MTISSWGVLTLSVAYIIVCLSQDNFTSEDFEGMSAPLVYKMFKSKSQFPLHTAIRTKREDAVFLYLVEHDAEVMVWCLVGIMYVFKHLKRLNLNTQLFEKNALGA